MSEDDPLPRVVFDCMVYLQATVSDSGPAASLLRCFDNNGLILFVSSEVLEEVREVLARPKIRQRNPNLTDERVDALIRRVSGKATMIDAVQRHFIYARDPKDEKYVNLAVEAGASYIVSRDKDLLDLMTGYTDECKEFRQRFRPLKVVEPVEFLATVMPKETGASTGEG